MTEKHAEEIASATSNLVKVLGKLNWKHGVALSLAIGLIIYPKPVVKLFMPLIKNFNKNHHSLTHTPLIKQVILTTNESITMDRLTTIKITKGTQPKVQEFNDDEKKTIEWVKRRRKRSNIFESNSSQIPTNGDQNYRIYGQTLWNSFRLTKLEDKKIKCVLIKSSQAILHIFLLRFYQLAQDQIHKLGSIPPNRLHILRLDQRVGTYEHFTAQFEDPS